MRNFSIRQMRREIFGAVRIFLWAFTALMIAAGAFGAAAIAALHWDESKILLLSGVMLCMALGALGFYYVFTDEKRLIRSTIYGRFVRQLGEPKEIMRIIDENAMKSFDSHETFALTPDFLIIYVAMPWKYEKNRSCALPLPKEGIEEMILLPADPAGKDCKRIGVLCRGAQYTLTGLEDEDIASLRAWIGERERVML